MFKKFLLRAAVFLILLALLDLLAGTLLRKLYFKQNHGSAYRTTYVLESATPDIMILGSSKASHDYIPAILEDSLQMTCYNGGRDGTVISYSNAMLNGMLKRYTPRVVVLDILEEELENDSYKAADKLSALLPYYRGHPEIRSIVDMKSPFEKYKLLSGMYTYNTLLLSSITGTIDLNNKRSVEEGKGYLPLNENWDGETISIDDRGRALDTSKINNLKNIIQSCKEKNVKLIIVISPVLKTYVQDYNATIDTVSKMAASNQVPFWSFVGDTTFMEHKSYFKDLRHLNDAGAHIFTDKIIRKLKTLK